jgi:signal transduction histidine kinase
MKKSLSCFSVSAILIVLIFGLMACQNKTFNEYITCTNKFRKIGFGLELFNCKKIIEAHQGKIWANKEINKGTSITFCLPIN